MLFDNDLLNLATIILAVLLVLTVAALIAFYKSKEGNSLKYPNNVRLRKYKFSEPLPKPPVIEDYEKEFSK